MYELTVLNGNIRGGRRLAGRGEALAIVLSLAVLLVASPASACRAHAALELSDIQYASVVVVGRIQNYKIVQATDARSRF